MTLHEIEKQLAQLRPELTEVSDSVSSETVNKLLAILESCYSIAAASKEEIQRLVDEINKLKGEDGKAKIKGNTCSSYSTEKERQAGQASSKPSEIGFKLTKDKLEALGETQIPENVLDALADQRQLFFFSTTIVFTDYSSHRFFPLGGTPWGPRLIGPFSSASWLLLFGSFLDSAPRSHYGEQDGLSRQRWSWDP
jgi:hypothetical protein